MKAKVFVTLKQGILDPQGKAIQHSAELIGFENIADVRQGKYFEIEVAPGTDENAAKAAAEKLAEQVLANPVIEDYRVEVVNG